MVKKIFLLSLVILSSLFLGAENPGYRILPMGINVRDAIPTTSGFLKPLVHFDLETLGLSEIRSFLFLDEYTTLLAAVTKPYGEKNSSRDVVILALNVHNGFSKEILRYSPGNPLATDSTMMLHLSGRNDIGMFLLQKEPRMVVILSLYKVDLSGMRYYNTITYAQLVILEEGHQVFQTPPHEIENVSVGRDEEPRFGNSRHITVLLRDTNRDGYEDIIFVRNKRSRKHEPPEEGRPSCYWPWVMTYDPEGKTFSEPKLDCDLPDPDPQLLDWGSGQPGNQNE